ncbi:effector binding domain-containing protein [Leptospira sp. 2 VSF19]|uniref:Effector binding domain-containing protein n=1 Tax=Leptospira soteropolitanensis TaxID=2950025 RepID=A0AAW5VI38_9LEPT|nr:effector binding domain-containing protein [Leptospira soteropolitanensis]MCW7492339.1 effector binding domain-containing protein [Leptospira soteropolitanensis]MCW7499921.1 effector binding domain-containing protein [Leptospira soteropolitanensis]MCW7522172.1 effector binding domain-containing protein [Leptospira soteropolitanensis]MCW7526026.1 effector binding domain-containing protein [Leptospira soteropolitanensis]MCW7529860.1 effector binding domain-containing protein [Leptospira soter
MEHTLLNKIHLESMVLVGIIARTSNAKEMAGKGKIAALWQKFWEEGILSQIPNALVPSEIVVAYTEFETDENGEYTILIGTKVGTAQSLPPHLTAISVSASDYLQVPTEWGPISEIGIATWKKIWSEEKYRKNRSYKTDLEIYGANAKNPNHSQFDIYLGIRS